MRGPREDEGIFPKTMLALRGSYFCPEELGLGGSLAVM